MRTLFKTTSLAALLLLAFSITFGPSCTHAQDFQRSRNTYQTMDDVQRKGYLAEPQFDYLARAALRREPGFDFMRFRRYYAQTRQYDPLGEETLERMNELAFGIETEKDPEKNRLYMDEYQNLLLKHLANLGVVMQALSLSRTNPRFGDPGLFKWIKAGLTRDVLMSGNGRSLDDAYDVITTTEETVLITLLGLQRLDTISNKEGRIYYNMNEVYDPRTKEKWTLFVNTSFPMKFLEAKEKLQKSFTVDLHKQ
ncbi:MAG: hypothetical protein KDI46_04160 [Alphaproteobacteria bacterium]|nr:hypothetical protein [Alphaproteobacteria bacterium]